MPPRGHQRAQRLFTELLASTKRDRRQLNDKWVDVALTYKIAWDRELERRRALGITGPEPLPHPDHVVIDLRAGTAQVLGPATKEEKAEWDLWMERKLLFEEELIELEALRAAPRCRNKKEIDYEIDRTKQVLAIIRKSLRLTDVGCP